MRIETIIRWSMILGGLFGLVVLTSADGNASDKDKPKQATIGDLGCTQEGAIAKLVDEQWVCASDDDTNAETECGTGELLDGDGNCVPIPVDTNTNAETECGTGELLDGDGQCVPIPVVTERAVCPCAFNTVLPPIRDTIREYWMIDAEQILEDFFTITRCAVTESTNFAPTSITLYVDAGHTFEECGPQATGVSCECDAVSGGVGLIRMPVVSPEEAFACAKDINAYGVALAVHGVPVDFQQLCPEAP